MGMQRHPSAASSSQVGAEHSDGLWGEAQTDRQRESWNTSLRAAANDTTRAMMRLATVMERGRACERDIDLRSDFGVVLKTPERVKK